MTTTTTTRKVATIPATYILNCIDSEGYDIHTETEREKMQFLADTFKSEYGWAYTTGRYKSAQQTFVEWIMGLPSSFNIAFENYEIIKLAKEWGFLAPDADDRKEDKFLESYWNRIYMAVQKLCSKHGVDLMPR